MTTTEHGLAVRDGARGITSTEPDPANGNDRAPGLADVHEDGFVPRNSGRPDLYPGIPHHFRGPLRAAASRLDEVTARDPEPAPGEPPAAVQAPPPALSPLRPAAGAPAVAP